MATAMTAAQYTEQLETLSSELRGDQDRAAREYNEIDLLIRQVQNEADRMTNREQAINNRVRDMEINLENYTRENIKQIYDQAQDISARLAMHRGQIEQLQAKKQYLSEQKQRLTRVMELLSSTPEGFAPAKAGGPRSASELGADVTQQEMVTRVVQAQEDERLRISRQMHDGPAQSLSNLVLRAEICERLMDMDVTRARGELASLKNLVNSTLQATRQFIFDLRPMILDDLGLEPTLRRYLTTFTEKTKVEANLQVSGIKGRLPQHLEVAAFRLVQEALSNVATHANASQVQVGIEYEEGDLNVTIEDNGSGFDVESRLAAGQGKAMGIASMRQRVEMLSGNFDMESEVGRGTRVKAMLPVSA